MGRKKEGVPEAKEISIRHRRINHHEGNLAGNGVGRTRKKPGTTSLL